MTEKKHILFSFLKKRILIYFIDWSLLLLTGLSPGAASRGTTLGLLVSVASLVVENQLQGTWAPVVSSPGLSSHGSWA